MLLSIQFLVDLWIPCPFPIIAREIPGVKIAFTQVGATQEAEGWPYGALLTVAELGESGPAGVLCTVMDGSYRLPCRTVPSSLAAQLRSEGISSCCYIVKVHNQLNDYIRQLDLAA
jgi:hypothetical protein